MGQQMMAQQLPFGYTGIDQGMPTVAHAPSHRGSFDGTLPPQMAQLRQADTEMYDGF